MFFFNLFIISKCQQHTHFFIQDPPPHEQVAEGVSRLWLHQRPGGKLLTLVPRRLQMWHTNHARVAFTRPRSVREKPVCTSNTTQTTEQHHNDALNHPGAWLAPLWPQELWGAPGRHEACSYFRASAWNVLPLHSMWLSPHPPSRLDATLLSSPGLLHPDWTPELPSPSHSAF